MEDRLKKRAIMFYIAGVVNLFLGLYVLIEGRNFKGVDPETLNWMVVFFLVFAAVDFWFPSMLRKKMLEEQAKLEATRKAAGGQKP